MEAGGASESKEDGARDALDRPANDAFKVH
jgi:hypothetical protein